MDKQKMYRIEKGYLIEEYVLVYGKGMPTGNSFNASACDIDITGISFSDDKKEMYLYGKQNEEFFKFSLDKPGNIKKAVFVESYSITPLQKKFSIKGLVLPDTGRKPWLYWKK